MATPSLTFSTCHAHDPFLHPRKSLWPGSIVRVRSGCEARLAATLTHRANSHLFLKLPERLKLVGLENAFAQDQAFRIPVWSLLLGTCNGAFTSRRSASAKLHLALLHWRPSKLALEAALGLVPLAAAQSCAHASCLHQRAEAVCAVFTVPVATSDRLQNNSEAPDTASTPSAQSAHHMWAIARIVQGVSWAMGQGQTSSGTSLPLDRMTSSRFKSLRGTFQEVPVRADLGPEHALFAACKR